MQARFSFLIRGRRNPIHLRLARNPLPSHREIALDAARNPATFWPSNAPSVLSGLRDRRAFPIR